MYYVYLGGELAFDPLSDSPLVTSATVSQEANAAAYLDMSLAPSASPEVGQAVSVLWDGEVLFGGTVSEATRGIEGAWDVTAESGESRLGWVLVPPHSSSGSVGDRCPATVAGYVQWLAEALNRRAAGGWRVDVGVNEGALLAQGGALSVSEDSWRTVADLLDSNVLSLGGWLGWEPREGGATLSLYADVRDAASQVVELGANVADMSSGLSSDGLATAIVAYSGDLTLDGLSEDELALASNAGMMVSGGALYDPAAVALYGYREEREELQASTRADLVRASVARLRESSSPTRTVECRAVDMALAGGGPHLRAGQAVRVRAQPLGVDEYMVVRSVSLDLMDPGQTSYELGAAHDTLTGQQSARLRELNLGIDHSLDLAAGAAGAAQSAHDAALSAQGAADAAQSAADIAQGAADAALDAAQPARDDADAASGQAQSAMAQAAEAARAAQEAAGRADELQQQVADVTTTVNGVEQDVSALTSQVSGAAEDASQALEAASSAQQDLDGFKTTVSQTYETKADADAAMAQEVLDRNSAISQSASEITQTVSETYVTKADADADYQPAGDYLTDAEASATFATQSGLTQTANSIRSEVAETYQTQDGMSSYATKSYVDQQDGSITSTVSEVQTTADSALTKATQVEQTADGLSVRLTQAESDVDAAQETADSASSTASAAQSAASAAQTTANTARNEASDAAKTATNYLGFSSGGLVVGDQTGASLGKNVLIDADSVDVRDGTTVLSSFGKDRIDLGKSSQGATISLCGGQVEFRYIEGSGLVLSQGLYSTGAMSCTQLSCRGVLNATGPLYLGDGQRAALRGVYAGTVVVTLSGGHATLLTKSQFTAIVGREPRGTDVVLAANGDRAAYIGEPLGCAYNSSAGTWYVGVPNSASGPYRANYLIIATA